MEQEKDEVRFNSEGERLYNAGDGVWLPEGYMLVDEVTDYYESQIVRPKISLLGIILNILLPIGANLALAFILKMYYADMKVPIVFGAFMLVYVFLQLKNIIIFAITLYQRYAPARVRAKCVYFPSCSNYAILALRQYGVIVGVIKSIRRLKRCHPPNEGEDYP